MPQNHQPGLHAHPRGGAGSFFASAVVLQLTAWPTLCRIATGLTQAEEEEEEEEREVQEEREEEEDEEEEQQ